MLTDQQRRALDFIAGRERDIGVCPSHEEIATALALKATSKGRVNVIINELVEKGRLRRMAGKHRALEVIPQELPGATQAVHTPTVPLVHPGPEAQFFVVWKEPGEDMRLVPMEGKP